MDNYCIKVVLRCLAVAGDGLGPDELNDGGILGTIMAAGFKGKKCIDGTNLMCFSCELLFCEVI